MDFDLNELILSFTKANIEFSDVYLITIPTGGSSFNSTTSPGVCGIVIPLKGKARFTIDKYSMELEPFLKKLFKLQEERGSMSSLKAKPCYILF